MYEKCIMTWKTFLDLFKEHYEYFEYIDGNWTIRTPQPWGIGKFFLYCKIILNFPDEGVPDGLIYFINPLYSKVTFIEQEDLQWNPISKNIIIF